MANELASALDYCKAGVYPSSWYLYKVVYEDGIEVPDCIECDVKQGYAVRYLRTPAGNMAINPISHDYIFQTIEQGNFKIVLKDQNDKLDNDS